MYARSLNILPSEVIEADICVINAQRVEQVEDGLSHHRRTAEVVLDVFWSVVLLQIGVAQDWSNEASGIFNTQSVCLRIWTVLTRNNGS